MNIDEDYLEEWHDNYGTPNSLLLKEVRTAGFKPIGITVLCCEETFIFKGESEAHAAAEKFLPEGWWYGFGTWEDTRQKYVKEMYNGDEDIAPTIYWFDKNFAPKERK